MYLNRSTFPCMKPSNMYINMYHLHYIHLPAFLLPPHPTPIASNHPSKQNKEWQTSWYWIIKLPASSKQITKLTEIKATQVWLTLLLTGHTYHSLMYTTLVHLHTGSHSSTKKAGYKAGREGKREGEEGFRYWLVRGQWYSCSGERGEANPHIPATTLPHGGPIQVHHPDTYYFHMWCMGSKS